MAETLDDEPKSTDPASAGEQLRAAREEKGLTLEDVAAQTRIPRRHLESLENSDWEHLPAPTYTTGFAKSYASVVGLDRVAIGERLREDIGGHRLTPSTSEVFEPADPRRSMPKWLVFGAIAVVLVLVLLMSWLNQKSVEGGADSSSSSTDAIASADTPAPPVSAPAPSVPVPGAPVAITASEPVWIQVYEKGGKSLFVGELAAGQRFDVPPTATAPMLKTGKPEALRISVGTAEAPPVGPPATTVRDVSLLGPDVLRGPAAAATPARAAAAPARQSAPQRQTAPAPASPTSAPTTQNSTG